MTTDLSALLGEHRREELLQLARAKLAEVRGQHRALSDGHLTAKMSKERIESSIQRWVTLRDRCRQAARTIDGVRGLSPEVQDLIFGSTSSGQDGNSMDEQIRLLEEERERLVRDEVEQRSRVLEPVEERLRLALAAQAEVQAEADRLDQQLAQRRAIHAEIEALNRRLCETTSRIDATVAESKGVQTECEACQSTIAELEGQITQLSNSTCDENQESDEDVAHENRRIDGESVACLDSSTALCEAREALQAKRTALETARSECEALRARNTSIAEVEVEQKRLADTQTMLAESLQLLAALDTQRAYLDAKQTESIVSGSIASTDINLQELESSGRGMPTVAELQQSYIPALQRQVESLSEALSAANEDLFLLQDDAVVSRCTELQLAIASYHDVTLPRLQTTIQDLCVSRLDAKRAVAAWEEEEGPRHHLYLDQLAEDEAALQAKLEVLQAEEKRLTERVAAAAVEADTIQHRRNEFAAEQLQWTAAGTSDNHAGDVAKGDHNDRRMEEEDQWVEILDVHGRVRKRVRIPRPMRPTFFTPAADSAAVLRLRGEDDSDKGSRSPNAHKKGFSLREPVRSFFRSFVDLVRGKPVVIPGGGASLTFEV